MTKISRLIILSIVVVVIAAYPQNYASGSEDVGVILMHGKGGTAKPNSPIGKLSEDLIGAGRLRSNT